MNTQKEKAVRDLDASIYKIMDSYRMLLRKSQVNTAGTMNVHEELQVETASASIVSRSWSGVSFLATTVVLTDFSVACNRFITRKQSWIKYTICGCNSSFKRATRTSRIMTICKFVASE